MHQKIQSKNQDGLDALNLGSRAVVEARQLALNALHKFPNDLKFLMTDWHKKTFNAELYTLAAKGNLIKNLLQKFRESMPSSSQLQHGTLRTVHSIDTFQVTIPDIEFKHPNFGHLQIGDLVFQVYHIDDRYDGISIHLPSEFTVCTPKGVKGQITVVAPSVKIHWDNHSQTSSEIEINLQNFIFSLDQGGTILCIRRLLAKSNVVKFQEKWAGSSHLNFQDVTLTNGNHEIFAVKNAHLTLDLVDEKPSHQVKNARAGLPRNLNSSTRLDAWMDFLTLLNRAQLRTAITGLRIQNNIENSLQLADTRLDIDVSVSHRKVLDFNLDTRYKGLNKLSAGETSNKFPEQFALAFSLENMPVAAIVKGLETFAELVLLGRENVDWKILKRLRYQLVVAGTALRLKKVKIRWNKIGFDLSLAMFASMVAKSGFISTGVVRICGLKTFLTILGICNFQAITELIKNKQPDISDKYTSFDVAVCPDGMLTINRYPVFTLASLKENHN